MDKLLSLITGGALGLFTFMFGTEHVKLIKIMIFLVVIDLVAGVIVSVVNNTFSRKVLYKGIAKKIFEVFIIAVAYQVDKTGLLQNSIDLEHVALGAYIGYEAWSIMAKAKESGIFLPKQITDTAENLIKGDDQNGK